MNLSFDKALLWLIPYLYLLSVSYYWGFWSTFNVDAFSYYAVSDLVKGVIAPIGTPTALTALLVFGIAASAISLKTFSEWIKNKQTKTSINLIIYLCFFVLLMLAFTFSQFVFAFFFHKRILTNPDDKYHLITLLNGLFTIPVIILSFKIAIFQESYKSFNHFLSVVIYTGFLLYLPCQGFLAGKENAMRISQNKEFDYVITDSLAGPKGFYKYLGKAGDYHILVTLDNVKRIIVPADELKPLVIEQYSLDVPASIRRFRLHMRQLLELSIRKGLTKK